MKGFITTAPLSKEAQRLLSDKGARLKIYKEFFLGKQHFDVTSGSSVYSVSTTPALTVDQSVLAAATDKP